VDIFFKLLEYRRAINIAISVIVILIIGWIVAYEPVTRKFVAQDALCNYCHLPWEYNPEERLTSTNPHQREHGKKETQATCVDCHLPKGWWNTTYAYTHFLSFTDLFGHLRDRDAERAGDWIPPRAAAAFRVRDRLYEYDGKTCRTCHIESEIKFTRERGVNAHKLALKEQKTCIECHNNLVHRPVDVRKNAFKKATLTIGSDKN
jgi:nitrate/TMAO reductase-like tetraheme cytochrome c subunit